MEWSGRAPGPPARHAGTGWRQKEHSHVQQINCEQSRLSKESSGGCGNEQMTRSGELSNFRRGPLYGSGGHIREQQAESLGHRRVRESGIGKH
jgi:hypothetical protein